MKGFAHVTIFFKWIYNDSNIQNETVNIVFIEKIKSIQLSRAFEGSEAAIRGVLSKKVFLEISQNSQENNCARISFFNKVAGPRHKIHRKTPVPESLFLIKLQAPDTNITGKHLCQSLFF